MLIFWIILIWVIFFGFIGCLIRKKSLDNLRLDINSAYFWNSILMMSIIVFFAGLRSAVSDTTAYINWFKGMPNSIENIFPYLRDESKDLGFVLISSLFKCFISDNYQVWLFVIAIISCIGIFIGLYRYSCNYSFSMFLFITSCYFTWLFNGMRQFLVAAILFGCMSKIVNKKTNFMIITILLLSTIHISALFMIPVYFIVQLEPWNKRVITCILAIILAIICINPLINTLDSILSKGPYSEVVKQFSQDDGVNKLRVLFEAIPLFIAFWKKDYISKMAPRYIKISINMSLIAILFFLLGTVTSGIYIGRIPIYFSLYNIILIPWLLTNVFNVREKPLVYYGFILLYLMFFYYQMVIAWEGFGYISEPLNIHRRWMSNLFY